MRKLPFINFFPVFTSFIFILISTTINPPQGYSFITPSVSIVCLIYWSLRKNFLHMNLLQTFFLGILNDCMMGTPIGSSSLLFILTRVFLLRLEKRVFTSIYITDIITVFFSIIFYYLSVYIFVLIYFDSYTNINFHFMSFLLTLFLYPIIYTILNRLFNNTKIEDL